MISLTGIIYLLICVGITTANESCVPLKSQFCLDYNGLMVPYISRWSFDINVFRNINLQGHSCKGYVPGITSMNCYASILQETSKCNNTENIIQPCRAICRKMYEKLLSDCYSSSDKILDDICDDLPNTDCVSSASLKVVSSFIIFSLLILKSIL